MDLFRKLGSGAKFDLRRFQKDAERFQLVKPAEDKKFKTDLLKALDFFGTSAIKHGDVNSELAAENSPERPKRKIIEEAHVERKKKKKKTITESHSGAENTENFSAANLDDVQLLSSWKPENKEEKKMNPKKIEQIRREKVNAFRKKHKIHISGTDIPDPIDSFQQLKQEYKINSTILKNVEDVGYQSPTPIQMQTLPLMLHRREVLACAPTGSGKTAAFIIPVLHHLKEPRKQGFRAVVVSPTRELAQQTYREFCRLAEGRSFRIHIIDKTSQAAKKFGPQSSQKFDILVTTPNRLVYMLNQHPPALNLTNVEWLIVDESDKLFEEGKQGFREQLALIYKACDSMQVRRAMFSATFAYDVEQWCKLNLDNVASVTIGQRNAAVDTIEQELLFVGQEYGKLLAIRDIIRKGVQPPMLVFVQSKERAKELFLELIYDGINVDVIHADRTQTQRDNVVRSFRAGKIWILICTELMGRGIDFKGVNLVVNYDFPSSAVSYIHRIGRTGRAGRAGRAVTFFTHDDVTNLRSIANVMREAGCPVPDYMLELPKPSKKTRKQLAKHEVKRETIRTLPTDILQRTKRKKKFIKMIKQRRDEDRSVVNENEKKVKIKTRRKSNEKPVKETADGGHVTEPNKVKEKNSKTDTRTETISKTATLNVKQVHRKEKSVTKKSTQKTKKNL
uniref:Probable ATP-dependent RNA helicase DDX52 n=1 Tax=Saccoglossus kowalevskii TaxID=10224 RepID=A0ABM0GZR7_SACKO|nr:PREDICTED: probable ATP-dependent RNA helicase DDX52-like [Saccoglossus kowalevskii]